MNEPLAPGSAIGILGGGQLGRMLSVAASRLGLRSHVFDPSPDACAGHVADAITTAAFDDLDALGQFAESVDVATYEFENVPAAAIETLEAIRPVRPGPESLRASQDRLTEKEFLSGLGLSTAPWASVEETRGDAGRASLEAAVDEVGLPAILKTRRLGYDGKGQARISATTDIGPALDAVAGAPSILEGVVKFEAEISVIAARGLDGETVCFDPGENVHRDGILRTTVVPARIARSRRDDAVLAASSIVNALGHVGVLGVELFVVSGGIVVNEIAPRVHNSGHWTQDGCAVDQFEQHVRAICGWPLGDGSRYADVEMENLIGDDTDRVPQIAAEPDSCLHLYGKSENRPGRKMGHINRIRRT